MILSPSPYKLEPANRNNTQVRKGKSSSHFKKFQNTLCSCGSGKKFKKCCYRGLMCYGFLKDDGTFDTQLFTSKKHAYIAGSVIAGERQKGTFVNCEKEAEWLCISTFKNSRAGRVESNISHMLCSFLDIDGVPQDNDVDTVPVREEMVIQRCYLLGLPIPLIIQTSEGRFHVKWYYRAPVGAGKLKYWKLVEQALCGAFKDLGADPKALDAVRFLRNEKNSKAVVVEQGSKCTLSQLYRALKKHGYIKQPERIPLEVSRRKLVAFLRANNNLIGTHEELATYTGIALRTLKHLIAELRRAGKLATKILGKGDLRRTKFTLIFKVHKEKNLNGFYSGAREKAGQSKLLAGFLSGGACSGVRNFTVFACTLELKIKNNFNLSFAEAVETLEQGFRLCDSGFRRREFLKCIRSALRDKYRFCYSKRKLIALGLLNSECEKVPVLHTPDSLGESVSELVEAKALSPEKRTHTHYENGSQDTLLKHIQVMNLRRFGNEFYGDNKPDSDSDSQLMEIRRKNLERFGPDFYNKP